jgi:hypothetical protein
MAKRNKYIEEKESGEHVEVVEIAAPKMVTANEIWGLGMMQMPDNKRIPYWVSNFGRVDFLDPVRPDGTPKAIAPERALAKVMAEVRSVFVFKKPRLS